MGEWKASGIRWLESSNHGATFVRDNRSTSSFNRPATTRRDRLLESTRGCDMLRLVSLSRPSGCVRVPQDGTTRDGAVTHTKGYKTGSANT